MQKPEEVGKDVELLPCPFCGSEAHIYQREDNGYWRSECMNTRCNAAIDDTDIKQLIIDSWNTRKHSPESSLVPLDKKMFCKELYNHFGDCIIKKTTGDNIYDLILKNIGTPPSKPAVSVEDIQEIIKKSNINNAHWTQKQMASHLLAQAIFNSINGEIKENV